VCVYICIYIYIYIYRSNYSREEGGDKRKESSSRLRSTLDAEPCKEAFSLNR